MTARSKRNGMNEENIIKKAKKAAENARVPLSKYRVGAAILSENGRIFQGCNIEFDNYSNTIHAEEAAISAMISAGDKKPIAIAVYTSGDKPEFPCGMCRQSLFEIGGENLKVIACNNESEIIKNMGDLLPYGFRL